MNLRSISVLVGSMALALTGAQSTAPQAGPPRERLERAYRASNRGVALLEQYDYAAAATAFREALQIEPALAAAHLNLSLALLYGGQFGAALLEARDAAARLPRAPQPAFVLGLIARADDHADDAEAAFRQVLAIDPVDAAANVNLGQLLLQKRQFPEAIAAFRAAAGTEPYNASAAYGLATALMRSGDSAAGQSQMTRFQTLRDSAYAVTYAQGYLQQGRYAEAIVSTGAEPELVDRQSPAITFADAGVIGRAGGAAPPAGEGAAVLLFDVDRDGDLDLLLVGPTDTRLLRNERGAFTATDLLPPAGANALERGASAGDFDNDGRADLFIFGAGASRLQHQRDGRPIRGHDPGLAHRDKSASLGRVVGGRESRRRSRSRHGKPGASAPQQRLRHVRRRNARGGTDISIR